MSVLTSIDGVPLFSTPQEALNWASQNNAQGYHTHPHSGQIGYMGGASHAAAVSSLTAPTITTTPQTTTSSGGGGGY